jgi:hypothetical protein
MARKHSPLIPKERFRPAQAAAAVARGRLLPATEHGSTAEPSPAQGWSILLTAVPDPRSHDPKAPEPLEPRPRRLQGFCSSRARGAVMETARVT